MSYCVFQSLTGCEMTCGINSVNFLLGTDLFPSKPWHPPATEDDLDTHVY